MTCPYNLANNRQARMLANLSLSGCYRHGVMSPEARDCTMLRSAKRNLRQLAFFGLTEYQRESQYLFEKTFRLKFRQDFVQHEHTHGGEMDVSPEDVREILNLNRLDVHLYMYAKQLFFHRLDHLLLKEGALSLGDGTSSRGYGSLTDNRANDVDDAALSHREDYEESDDGEDGEGDEEFNRRITER